MTTPGERIFQERTRQRLSRKELGARIGVSEKTIQRIESNERASLVFLVEEALGLPPSGGSKGDEIDEDEVLRNVSEQKFWLEAARRSANLAEQAGQIVTRGELPDEVRSNPDTLRPQSRSRRHGPHSE